MRDSLLVNHAPVKNKVCTPAEKNRLKLQKKILTPPAVMVVSIYEKKLVD